MSYRFACALAVVLAAASSGLWGQGLAGPAPAPATPPAADAKADENLPIEVCFVVDTTGSMSGLIEGAKRKIWSIANDIVQQNPKAPLKIGLVAYRDKGDAYVTRK